MSGYRSLLESRDRLREHAESKLEDQSPTHLPFSLSSIPAGNGKFYIDGEELGNITVMEFKFEPERR